MRVPELFRTPTGPQLGPRPQDSELDLFGMTHPGKVRPENQDHFLLCTIHPQVLVHATSLPDLASVPMRGQRLATILLVADGVGGAVAGEDASRLATQAIMRYVTSSVRSYHTAGTAKDEEFLQALRAAALEAHDAVRQDAREHHEGESTATTLTLGMVVWPWLYVLQVGDSRCYVQFDGKLVQVSRDHTVAQDMVDRGLLSPARAAASPYRHLLSRAIGAAEATPEVTRVDIRKRGTVVLVCTDGLTKHVSDAEIAQVLGRMPSAESACRELVNLALDRGGTDNITVVIGRARKPTSGEHPTS